MQLCTFSPSLFGSISGFCSEAGMGSASFQILRHEFPGSDILSESLPLGGHFFLEDDEDGDDESSSQSLGECHLIKSSKAASGFAALNADISDSSYM